MTQLARQAFLMAQGLKDFDLLARSEYWVGRACAGTCEQNKAVENFHRTQVPDHHSHDGRDGKNQTLQMTTEESKDANVPLQKVRQRAKVQQTTEKAFLLSQSNKLLTRHCDTSPRDVSYLDQPLTIKNELDAIFECLDYEDGYGDLLDHLEDERFDSSGLLSLMS
ncbi:hypothetical protein E8E12_002695 [Didymella heteroderae]|uniref:Uncharacterized protein n=1 Tax=Didymella heteroderae TaxID=1769908 RepID=A0A9P4WIQ6_9PLEO|nr:hypothetical protein E8E12_002695 [Didymella heteroderae]